MRIACPSCAATYDVPDRLLAGPARTLRCSRCGAGFPLPKTEPEVSAEPEPPSPATPSPPPVTPAPPAEAAPPSPPRPEPLAPRRPVEDVAEAPQPALLRAWVASIVVVVAAIASLLVFHAKVMEVWPASTRLFAALGLA